MNAQTARGYQDYASVLVAAGARHAPVVVPAGRAFELIYNGSAAPPLSANSTFSCLYHHHTASRAGSSSNFDSDGGAGCTLDGFGLGGHPSPLGTYLIACTFVAALLGQSPVGVAWAPEGLTEEERDLMQKVAERAVRGASLSR